MAITFIQSPNYNKGRSGSQIKKIVCHWIGAGTYEGAVSHLTNQASQVSAHYVISGNRVSQLVKDEDTAWHAGNLTVNRESIGIEHDAIPGRDATEETYQTSGKLIGDLCRKYNIPIDRSHIVKHSEIKATQCPGTIDLDKLINIAKGTNMAEIDDLKKRVAELEKEVDVKNQQIGNYSQQVAGLLEKIATLESSTSQSVDLSKWKQNGMIIKTIEGNKEITINYARI